MATNPILDIQIRKRESTNVPLPFAEMYAVLAEKQKRYDDAEKYEREQKLQISKTSSPIVGYNNYLTKKKQNFLDESLKLHSSMPDKGHPEYQRKLNQLLDSWNTDPTVQTIDKSNQQWSQRLDVMKQLVTNGTYSANQDIDKDFTGVDENGNIMQYTFLGIKPKPDYMTAVKNAAALVTPRNKITSYVDRKRNKKIITTYTGKETGKVKNEIVSALTPEMKSEIMFDNKLPDENALNLWIDAQSYSLSDPTVSNQEEEDFTAAAFELQKQGLDLQKQQLELEKQKAKAAAAGGFSGTETAPVVLPNTGWTEDAANSINDDGTINTGFWGDEKSVKEDNPVLADIAKNNILTNAWRKKNGLKPIPLSEMYKRYKNSAYQSVAKSYINTNSKDIDDAYDLLMTRKGDAEIWDISEGKNIKLVDQKDRSAALIAFDNSDKKVAKASFSGKYNPANPYGPRAYEVTVGDKKYVLSIAPTADQNGAIASQENKIFKGFTNYSPVSFGANEYQEATKTSNGDLKLGKRYNVPVDVYFPDPDDMNHRLVVPRKK